MLIFLVSFFSVILLSKSFPFKNGAKMELYFVPWFFDRLKKKGFGSKVENVKEKEKEEEKGKVSLLDLPELTLECILDRLSPAELCAMAGVCSSLRERCCSDHLWEKHMKQRWGRVIGDAAHREWKGHLVFRRKSSEPCSRSKKKGFLRILFNTILPEKGADGRRTSTPADSVMAWYISLETGEFWFPAQVYNRENGHAGFMLSCYDAKLKYNLRTDNFQARYSAQGRAIEENISWDRVRVAPMDTPSHDLHTSDCLHDLKPGDHVEIQWRRSKEFPYGWWYGVVGHLESCDGNENHCHCRFRETVMLEFRQYPAGSRWRNTTVNRKDHREVGNEADGFYGGMRKLYKEEEISMWKRLWPSQ
ncbi:hypothetical protein SLEP1_g48339 [Rubroshorea leprosula]|uniref:F-box domain-containing protein n=1 Tax=Rubroshorea leprosula TaxID=152421 RepID=A0AAV5LTB8_9ROSI|nr:hypothetical protein SLEP1_g48339 [Rubroshorea leprosula]